MNCCRLVRRGDVTVDETYHRAQKYYHGIGVAPSDRNARKAFQWFRQGAERGHAPSQCALGLCYYNGRGCSADATTAMHWFHEAALQGYAEAQYQLANGYVLHMSRLTFAPDGPRTYGNDLLMAAHWYRAAAQHRHIGAIRVLEDFFARNVLQEPATWTLVRQVQADRVDEDLRRSVFAPLLANAKMVTALFRRHRTSPLYERCMSRETFILQILQRICAVRERGITVHADSQWLARAYDSALVRV